MASAAMQDQRRPNVLFCITDDQSWLHSSVQGSKWIRTPALERLANKGVVFTNAYVSTPSCAPSRAAVLSGQDFYRLGPASMNHTEWKRGLRGYADALAEQGYRVGSTGKGWAPGNWKKVGRQTPPAGREWNNVRLQAPAKGLADIDYAGNFAAFLDSGNKQSPFCFWVGFSEPHRVFESGYGKRAGVTSPQVPAFLPDTPEVRADVTDYAAEIEWADQHLGKMLDRLERMGELENTLVVFTGDNGMAFPRAKGNLYEYGTHVPLLMAWPQRAKQGLRVGEPVSLVDVAPTILEATGAPPLPGMTGRSLLPRLTGVSTKAVREEVVFGIERHFPGSRPDGAGYPSRGIRAGRYLLIENLTPDRNPVGDRPGPVWPSDDPTGGFGDTDGGPSKTVLCRGEARHRELFERAFGKRPAVELYDVAADPANLKNLAGEHAHAGTVAGLRKRLQAYRQRTEDPRVMGKGEELDAVMRAYPTVSAEVSRQQEGGKQK
ncbi:MAG: sulfatase [Bryobacterales bacterium]|nr:sulfatase [Bryobacterales bacterium]